MFPYPSMQGPLNTSAARHAHLGGVDKATGAGARIGRTVGIGVASTAGHAHPGRIGEATTATARIGGLVGIAATAWQAHPCRIGEATGAAAGIRRYVLGYCQLLQGGQKQGSDRGEAKQHYGTDWIFHAKANYEQFFKKNVLISPMIKTS